MENARRKDITTFIARKLFPNVYHAEALVSRTATPVVSFTPFVMINILKILQLSVGKRKAVQHSVMNDEQLRDFSVFAIQEPHVWKAEGSLTVTPLSHTYWAKIIPTKQQDEKWAIRGRTGHPLVAAS